MTRVLLVWPPSPYLLEEFIVPPLGILFLGGYLKKYGHEVQVADLSGVAEWKPVVDQRVKRFSPDIIGFSSTTPQYPHCLRIRDYLRSQGVTAKMVVGGVHPTSDPIGVARDGWDSFVIDEGENAMLKICHDDVIQPQYKEPLIEDLDEIGHPDRDLIDIRKYKYEMNGVKTTTTFSQKGCVYSCLTAGTLITMQNGTKKPIEEINVGEAVWTYDKTAIKKSPSRVLATYSHEVPLRDIVKIWVSSYDRVKSRGKERRLWLTAEHEVYTQRGWIRADEVVAGDKMLSVWKNISEETQKRAIEGARRRMLSQDNPMKNAVYAAKMADTLRLKYKLDKDLLARIVSKGQRTRIDKQGGLSKGQRLLLEMVQSVIGDSHKVESEYPLLSFSCDVAVPDLKIDFEYDGHHRHWTRPEHDVIRDAKLREVGWTVVRFANREIWDRHASLSKISMSLGVQIENRSHWITVRKVARMKDKKRTTTVYDLSVEPAHTFVANGLLVANCVYCEGPLMGRFKVRYHSPQWVVEECDLVNSYGFGGILFFDDEININIPRLHEICRRIKSHKMLFRAFYVAAKSSVETLQLMKDAGFYEILVGFESGSPEILRNIHKPQTVDIMRAFAKQCAQVGMRWKAACIVGLPGETWDTVRQTEKLLTECAPSDLDVSILQIYPGSGIARNEEHFRDLGLRWDIDYHNLEQLWFKSDPSKYQELIRVETSGMSKADLIAARMYLESKFKPPEWKEKFAIKTPWDRADADLDYVQNWVRSIQK